MVLIPIRSGEEVIETLTKRLEEHGIRNGAIASVIGAVDSAAISNMPSGDATSDVITEYHQPIELSATGEITDGRPHIHAVLGIEGDKALSGHLHWAVVQSHFVNIYVIPLGTNFIALGAS